MEKLDFGGVLVDVAPQPELRLVLRKVAIPDLRLVLRSFFFAKMCEGKHKRPS